MKIKAVSGLKFIVSNPMVSADFYEKLGFIVAKRESDVAAVRSNWFWIELTKGNNSPSDAHMTYLSVDNAQDAYKELTSLNLDPTAVLEVEGKNETTIFDPDGNKLVFFSKK